MSRSVLDVARGAGRRVRRFPEHVVARVAAPADLRASVTGATAARRYMANVGIQDSWNNAVIVQKALERDLQVGGDERRRVRLRSGRRTRRFDDGKVSVNQLMARRAAWNKDVAGRLLRAHQVRVPGSEVFETGDAERAWAWAEPILPLVLKPTDGARGGSVYVGVDSHGEFTEIFDRIAREHGRVLVEEFVAGVEHRMLVVGGRVVAATRREPAHVVGNGRSDIAALVRAKNRKRLASPNPIHRQLKIDRVVTRELARQGLTMDSRPAAGDMVYLRSTSNTHFGGDAIDATGDLRPDEVAMVERAARAFNGLRIAGFDVLLPRGGRGAEPCIIELNSAPAIAMHHFPWRGNVQDAAGSILDLLFPATARSTSG